MQHTKHVFRVLIALVVLVVTYILVRGSFVPKSFGKHGAYRFDNVAEQRDQPLRHGACRVSLPAVTAAAAMP